MSKEFINLHKSDQRKLLARNVPLYVQYVLARYINSDSGYEQIRWLLGKVCEIMSSEEFKSIAYICRYILTLPTTEILSSKNARAWVSI